MVARACSGARTRVSSADEPGRGRGHCTPASRESARTTPPSLYRLAWCGTVSSRPASTIARSVPRTVRLNVTATL